MATEPKINRILKRIGTHNGVFHCDEALACFMLKQLPEYEDAEIIRTRDQKVFNNLLFKSLNSCYMFLFFKILDTCDVVVDVGSVYDPKINRFDHHQRSFEHTLSTVLPHISQNKHIR